MLAATRIILLAGTPSTGKSYFANWAARERQTAHIDAEQRVWAPDVESLHPFWGSAPGQVARFVEQVRCDGRSFIFN
jgi:hypothetical protein